MNKTTIWIIIAILVVAGLGAWWYASMQQPVAVVEDPGAQVAGQNEQGFADDSKDGGAAVSAFTVRLSEDGFSAATLTVKKGTTVTFINQSTHEMWIGSDEHPSHTGYDGTSRDEHCAQAIKSSFDQCGVGETYSFTFDKAGTWGYHNHRDASDHGTVVVTD